MAPRTSWKGFLKLSLISIPVKAHTANDTGEQLRLNQLHKGCHQRVKYQKVCPEHGELKQTDIVSGYEFSKDEYVVIDPAEMAKLRPESDKAVRIAGFVSQEAIDPIYQAGKTYYLLPDGVAGEKPYALLHQGLLEHGVVGVAQIVIAGREQLVMLRPLDGLLVVSVLHVAKRVKALEPYLEELHDVEVTKQEQQLTDTLIEASTIEEFDYAAYEDQYVERLRELIKLKIDGSEVVQSPEVEEPKILNLMDALKRSVAEAKASGKKMAASQKATKKKAAKKAAKKTTRRRKSG